jgi:hypothetical protein
MTSSRNTLLVTLRHPGPLDFVIAAIPKLSASLHVVILATDSAARSLMERYAKHLYEQNVTIWLDLWSPGVFRKVEPGEKIRDLPSVATNSPTQLRLNDHDGMNRLLPELVRLSAEIQPDIVLRTTPSHSIGVDELMPVALRSTGYNGPILALQDYYGVGLALGDDEHRIANVGVDAIATIDENASRMIQERLGIEATVVGWVAHETYLTGESHRKVRDEARAVLTLVDEKLILYAGICSNLPDDNDVKDFVEVVRAVASLRKRQSKIRFGYKLHPRTGKEEAAKYHSFAAQAASEIGLIDLPAFPSQRHYLAVADLIVSPASAFILEALAFGSVDREKDPNQTTVSLYTTGAYAQTAMKQLTGYSLLPTHEEDGGSLCSNYDLLDEMLERGLFDRNLRATVSENAARIYRPPGNSVAKLVDFILSSLRKRKCLFGEVGDEGVLLNLEDGNYFGLNASASRLWDLRQQSCAPSELCRRFIEEFSVPQPEHQAPLVTRFGDVSQILASGPQGKPSGLLGSAKGFAARSSSSTPGGPYLYSAYNLTISSPWSLPELTETTGTPDVVIRCGDLQSRAADRAASGFYKASPDEFFIYDPEVGAFLSVGTNEIVVDPAPAVDERLLHLFIMGPALAHLLHRRGLLLLHASAVASERGSIAFAGKTSWGKSTTAATFYERGWDFVTDDMLAVKFESNSVYVLPGYANMRLWPDAVSHFGEVPESLALVHPALDKRSRKFHQRMASQPLPLTRLYILAEGSPPGVETFAPSNAFLEVVRHTEDDVLKTLQMTNTVESHFRSCVKLVNTVPVRRLIRPLELNTLAELQHLIDADLRA